MKTIIIGGGRTGKELAAQLPDSVIIEKNPEKGARLKALKVAVAGVEVVIGDGCDEDLLKRVGLKDATTFISVTGDDDVNYRAARIAKRYGVPRIIARVEDPEDRARFQDLGVDYVIFPTKMIANLIVDLIRPREDKGIGSIDVPFKKILVPILDESTVNRALKEALLVASVARAEITVVSSPDIERAKMEMPAREMGVRLRVLMEDERLMDIIKRHLHYRGCIIIERVKEHLYYPDCIIIDQEEVGFMNRLLGRGIVLKLIKCASRPVLVARTYRYYEQILAILDSSATSESVGRYALLLAHLCDARLHLLILENIPELVEWMKRMGEKANIRIIENWIEGNPMIEAVKEVKSGKYQLAVIPWRGTGVIRADLIRRIINDAPCSVLTVV